MAKSARVIILESESASAARLKKTLKKLGYLVIGICEPCKLSVERAIQLKADIILMGLTSQGGHQYSLDNMIMNIHSSIKPEILKQGKIPPVVYLIPDLGNPACPYYLVNTDSIDHSCLLNKSCTDRQLKTTIDLALENHSAKQSSPFLFSDILGKYSKDLFTLINELKAGDVSELSLNLLIKVCFELARVNVKRKFSRISNLSKRWALSVEDVAIESISNLFVNNSKRKKMNLECFLNNWADAILDNTDALFFLNKIVNLCIDQYFNKLIRESDPFFAKTIDKFDLTIKRTNYIKFTHFGTVYILKNGEEPFPPSVNLIPAEEFEKISLHNKSDIKDILNYVMDYIEFNTEYFPAIPLNLLVQKFIKYNPVIQASSEFLNDFERISVDDIIYNSLRETIKHLKKTYVNTNKLSIDEADYLASALTDIAFDLREGNTIEQLPDYLGVYIKNFSIAEYKAKYRNIFEYLVKLFKKSLAGNLAQTR